MRAVALFDIEPIPRAFFSSAGFTLSVADQQSSSELSAYRPTVAHCVLTPDLRLVLLKCSLCIVLSVC